MVSIDGVLALLWGFEEIPVVWTLMTAEQMRISTLRHNRARGSEDEQLAGDVLKQLASLGALEHAQDSLKLDDVEVRRLIEDMGEVEAAFIEMDIPDDMLGPTGSGLTEEDKDGKIDLTADTFRAKQKLLEAAKQQEEKSMVAQDSNIYRLMLFFTGGEAEVIRTALDHGDGQAHNLLKICQAATAAE